MQHIVSDTPSGAECSCGKVFSVWAWRSRSGDTHNDVARRIPLARANARRHAIANQTKRG